MTAPNQIVLVELDTPSGLRYFSDGRYVDANEDIIAEARLSSRISFERRITTIFWGGGRARIGLGNIDLINSDGGLTDLVFADLRRRAVRILMGDDTTGFNDLEVVASGTVDSAEAVDEQLLRIKLADGAAAFAVPFSSAVYSAGDQVGQLVPIVLGSPLSCPVLATDIANKRFSAHNSSSNTIVRVLDNGVPLTVTTEYVAYNTSPHFGFQLQQATVGRILADMSGPQSTAYDLSAVGVARAPGDFPNVMIQIMSAMGWAAYDAVEFEAFTFTAISLRYFQVGMFIDGSIGADQIITEIADSFGAWWCVDRLGNFRIKQLAAPSAPTFSFNESNIKGGVSIRPDLAPGLSNAVAGVKNWHVSSPSELAGAVRDTAAGVALTKDYQSRFTMTLHAMYSDAEGAVGASREGGPAGNGRVDLTPSRSGVSRPKSDHGMATVAGNGLSLSNERTKRQAIWGDAHYWYNFTGMLTPLAAATLDPGIEVDLTLFNEKTQEVYTWADYHPLLLVSVRGLIGEREVQLECWGGGA